MRENEKKKTNKNKMQSIERNERRIFSRNTDTTNDVDRYRRRVNAFGVEKEKEAIKPMIIERRNIMPYEVNVKVLYCGICHSDYHHINNDWGDSKYPMVPGHEMVGEVIEIGDNVSKVKIGDIVAIGNMIDSCQVCQNCEKGKEQYCLNGQPTWVYNGYDRIVNGVRSVYPVGEITKGGYSGEVICNENFLILFDQDDPSLISDLPKYAPLFCAGITMYYPLKEYNIGKGHKVGIAGIGGLGHMGIKLAKALGAEVIALTTSPSKVDDCIKLGADDVVLMTDFQDSIRYRDKIDFIINTIPTVHDLKPYINLLKPGSGKVHIVGNLNQFKDLTGYDFVWRGKNITSSNVGGIPLTQELLNFCQKFHILPEVELISVDSINQGILSMVDRKVRYRYVIDLTTV